MNLTGTIALVTGGQRGLGHALAAELLEQGVAKVYVTARTPRPEDDPRLVPLPLDVTDPASVAALAEAAGDVQVLVNNAGIALGTDLLTGDVDRMRAEFDTNVFGTLAVVRAFAPVLARNGGGALLTVHSVLSWVTLGDGYSASKAAEWSMTNAFRALLAPAGTVVTGLHVGFMDTDMTAALDVPKTAPAEVARQAVLGILDGAHEVLADDVTRWAKTALAGDPAQLANVAVAAPDDEAHVA